MDDYDEDLELDRYFRRNFSHLMRDKEHELYRLMFLKEKIDASSSEDVKEQLRKHLAHSIHRLTRGEPVEGVGVYFKDLVEEHQRRIGPHIQALKNTLVPNRCPECNRIVRTPEARQCLWCGADWH